MGDILTTIADYNTLDTKDATRNLGIRFITFGVGERIGKKLNNADLDKPTHYMGDQFMRKSLDEIKDQSTVKPKK